MSFHVPNQYRIKSGEFGTDESYGNQGTFYIPTPYFNKPILVIASDGMGWEHVSASLTKRCPNWPEMCLIKDIFWDSEDAVIQIHPPKSKYVNQHPFCLHLWRPTNFELQLPLEELVGTRCDASKINKNQLLDEYIKLNNEV